MSKITNILENSGLIPKDELSHAINWIIYLVDLGYFLATSDIVVCNVDEPLDPGMIVEMMFAKMVNKPVIGYRTEMRTPYGKDNDFNTGMHFFCHFPCDSFIYLPNDKVNSKEDG